MNEQKINRVKSTTFLGITLDERLKFREYTCSGKHTQQQIKPHKNLGK